MPPEWAAFFEKSQIASALAELGRATGSLEAVLLTVKTGKHLCINGLRYLFFG